MKNKYRLLALFLVLILICGCSAVQTGDCHHKDADDNGICDLCVTEVIVTVDFYTINDLHGKIVDGDSQPGVDELTTYLKNAGQRDDHTILLSTGDMWQGSSESNLTSGMLTTEWMNALDFTAMTLGNHEYDWGEDAIRQNDAIAQFPFLAINIYDRQTNERVDYCDASTLVDLGSIQIGIIGAMGDCYSSISADKTENVYFKVGKELTKLVKDESDKLRTEGADYIVYVIHDGYGQSKSSSVTSVADSQLRSYYDATLSDGYVDLVFEGHTHQRYLLKDSHGVYHLQNKGENKGISHVEVDINFVTGTTRVSQADLIASGDYARLEDDPIVEELLQKYDNQIAPSKELLGNNNSVRNSGELKQLTADLYYQLGMEVWGAEYDIALGGGFISVRSPYSLPAGEVTYGQLQMLLPFDNPIVLCSIKGRDLQDKFFETKNDNYYISYGTYGAHLKESIDPNATYYLVTDSYTLQWAPNNLTEVARYDDTTFARDLLAEHIKSGGLG